MAYSLSYEEQQTLTKLVVKAKENMRNAERCRLSSHSFEEHTELAYIRDLARLDLREFLEICSGRAFEYSSKSFASFLVDEYTSRLTEVGSYDTAVDFYLRSRCRPNKCLGGD